jgi:SPP1 family predicted phage head-tail adaptor
MALEYGIVSPGRLRHRVTLQTQGTRTANADGQLAVGGWTDVGTYWAEVRPLSGRELANAAQIKATVTHSVTMRYSGLIDATSRILFGARIFSVLSVLNAAEKNRRYDLIVQEIQVPVQT